MSLSYFAKEAVEASCLKELSVQGNLSILICWHLQLTGEDFCCFFFCYSLNDSSFMINVLNCCSWFFELLLSSGFNYLNDVHFEIGGDSALRLYSCLFLV